MESPVQSSEITGEGEGCSSTESGWTMYLNSPMNDDEAFVHGDEGDEGDGEVYSNGDGFQDSNSDPSKEGEDDSLASDASTGNIEKKSRNMLDNHGDDNYYDGYDAYSYKFSSNVKKEAARKEKKEKKEKKGCFMSLFKGGDSSKGSSSKNWKTNFTGK